MATAAPMHETTRESMREPIRRRSLPRLAALPRKIMLIVHLASTAAWLGMNIVLGLLVFTALNAPPATVASLVAAIGTFVGRPLVAVALLALVSGVVLGLGSKYGLLRYWWVSVKLVMTVVLIALVIGVLVPSVAGLSETATADATGVLLDQRAIFPPVVSSSALLFAMALSVIKPWGRRHRARAEQP